MSTTMPTAKGSLEPRKVFSWWWNESDLWCGDDIVRQCFPDLSGRRQLEKLGYR